jgi:hemolysin activation/secretion protein
MLPAYGPGGMQGVRGLPEGRLHGNTKLIGNLELRSFFWKFRVAGQRLELGAAAFLDVGRVWTNSLAGVSGLDGSGLALHYGVGAGIRLRWGDSLVIRFDMHYSPAGAQLGSPVGLCVDVDPVL